MTIEKKSLISSGTATKYTASLLASTKMVIAGRVVAKGAGLQTGKGFGLQTGKGGGLQTGKGGGLQTGKAYSF